MTFGKKEGFLFIYLFFIIFLFKIFLWLIDSQLPKKSLKPLQPVWSCKGRMGYAARFLIKKVRKMHWYANIIKNKYEREIFSGKKAGVISCSV